MTQNDFFTFTQSNSKNTIISFSVGNEKYKFDSKIQYSDVMVFVDKKIVIVVHSISSANTDYLGAAFNFSGLKIADISFPKFISEHSNIHCSFSWSTYNKNVLKMFFGTDSVMIRDFWVDYNMDLLAYGDSGESR